MNEKKVQIKRGVTLFSYSSLFGYCMDLEDCLKDIADMGAIGVEILGSHVENYPNPSTEWVDNWFKLLDKYNLEPAEFGHWYDTRIYGEPEINVDEALEYVIRDFKIASMLGFKVLRTKLTTINRNCDPAPGWDKYLEKALPYAEKYDVRMCSEVHMPTPLTTQHIYDYMEFIERTGTKHFGFNVDFGTFQNNFPEWLAKRPRKPGDPEPTAFSQPEDIIPVLPYTYCCHGKYYYMDESFEEITIPYKEVLNILMDKGWSGHIITEYEGKRKDEPDFLCDQIRRHQIMMKRIIGN